MREYEEKIEKEAWTLEEAIEKGDNQRAKQLIEEGENFHASLMIKATLAYNYEMIAYLVESGLAIDEADENGLRAIIALAKSRPDDRHAISSREKAFGLSRWQTQRVGLLQFLFEQGGDVHQCDEEENTILHLVLMTYLEEAIRYRKDELEEVSSLLHVIINAGGTIDQKNKKGLTPLALFCKGYFQEASLDEIDNVLECFMDYAQILIPVMKKENHYYVK